MSIGRWMDKDMINICNEILLSHKNEQNNVSQHCNESESVGSSVVSDSLWPLGL